MLKVEEWTTKIDKTLLRGGLHNNFGKVKKLEGQRLSGCKGEESHNGRRLTKTNIVISILKQTKHAKSYTNSLDPLDFSLQYLQSGDAINFKRKHIRVLVEVFYYRS
jgi:hypothetical protein